VEARGNALERIREENDALTNDYNALRAHSAALEAESNATISDLQKQLEEARRSAAQARAAWDSLV
jgi:hypothetical protein